MFGASRTAAKSLCTREKFTDVVLIDSSTGLSLVGHDTG